MIFYKIITMLKANYHTHTKRCGHAIGEDEEYVLEAIGKGFRTLGFSDHAMFPTFSEPHVRGDYQQCFDDYISSINALRKKYSQKIEETKKESEIIKKELSTLKKQYNIK